MTKFLTDTFISTLKKAEGRSEVVDALTPGLRLRRTQSGDLIWSLWYRRRGTGDSATRYRLGKYSPHGEKGLTLAAARKAAQQMSARIERGEDPQAELQTKRRADRERRGGPKPHSVKELVALALSKLSLRPTTLSSWSGFAKGDIFTAPFAKKPANALAPSEVESWLARIADRSGNSANTARTILLRCYSWAVEKKLLQSSPIAGLPKPDPQADEKQCERVLSAAELKAVLLSLEEIEGEGIASRLMYSSATRLLLLTGVRRSAVLGMKRSELEGLGSPSARWVVPSERSKNGRPHVVPLSQQAVRLIEGRLSAVQTQHLFPQYRTETEIADKPMTWSSRFVDDLKARTNRNFGREIERWKIHGFRTSLATHCREALKVSGDVVSMLLSHTPPGAQITRVYLRSELLEERRNALAAWADWLDRLLTTQEAGNVIELRRRA